ncbi:TPA: hypothetical protein JL437_003606 [Escherichia coli]|nr:hypothetical protein [Escherichia coli]
MTTFTDKELIKEIKERISSMDVRDNVERRAYEIALASLEEDPVAWLHSDNGLGIPAITRSKNIADSWLSKGWYVQPLYIAKPVPVVPDARPSLNNGIVGFDEGWNACRAAMLQSGNFRENKNSSTNNFREIAETSTNYPAIPSEVLSAILKVARIRADFDDFDGDRRGIGDCLDEAEQELIVTINKYASQLAAEPIATNDVREQQTAVPPVPEIQDDVAQAIENLKQKLVECNRYNYCADAVKGVEDACHAAMLYGAVPASQAYKLPQTQFKQVADLYEMQFDDGRTCAFHTDAQKAVQWLQACDGNRVQEYVKLERLQNALSGNSPVTPDGWVMVPKRLTAENGAKGALSGEFSETTFISCLECFGDDDCDTCDGSGRIEIKVPVTWSTIKSIWDKGIEYFAAKPSQEVK